MQISLFNQEQENLTSDDYYTPKHLFDALDVKFDLDVASPPHATHVPCTKFYTQKDDGLTQPWYGNVWMNPPFSDPRLWVRRFVEHNQGIALLSVSKSRWFNDLWDRRVPMVLLPSDFRFEDPKGGNGSIFMPSALVALGSSNVAAIANIGTVR